MLRAVHAGDDHRAVTTAMFGGQGSHGNGAAMRVAPLGAWFADDLTAVAERADLDGGPGNARRAGGPRSARGPRPRP